jgi:hypothetical protein
MVAKVISTVLLAQATYNPHQLAAQVCDRLMQFFICDLYIVNKVCTGVSNRNMVWQDKGADAGKDGAQVA